MTGPAWASVTPHPYYTNMCSSLYGFRRTVRPAALPIVYRCRLVALPDFNEGGLLSVGEKLGEYNGVSVFGGHDTTPTEVRDRFVAAFPESWSRPALHREGNQFIMVARSLIPTALFYVWGDFVTDDRDPMNIGVTLVVTDHDAQELSGSTVWLLNKLFNSRADHFTDYDLTIYTEWCRRLPEGHHQFDDGQQDWLHKCYLASRPPETTEPRGYAELLHGEGE